MTRRGIFLVEIIVACVLLFALMAACLHFFSATASQRWTMERRQTALCEAANIMERLAQRPYSELTAETLSQTSLSEETQRLLSDGELKIEIDSEEAKPPAKRITITIRWQDQAGQWTQPVRLVAWRYQQ
ncbi:MAG TPA: hypothetical protein VIH42_13090 [Thermoguttaceae bacterium]